MSHWYRLNCPNHICERMLGFSIPINNQVLIVSYEGTHLLTLNDPIEVETDTQFYEYDIYDPDTGIARYRDENYHIIGLHGGSPILEGRDGERLVLDQKGEKLSVVKNGKTEFESKYSNFSGDWAAATFSPDGRYIVLGCPYDFDFIAFRRQE